jgi:hypothetical protein
MGQQTDIAIRAWQDAAGLICNKWCSPQYDCNNGNQIGDGGLPIEF